MAVFSMVSSKGGAGKTTAAVLLASEIARAGKTAVLIDGDPNQPIVNWSQLPAGLPDNVMVMADDGSEGETIRDSINEAKSQGEFVIIDLEGRAEDRSTFAIAESDFVLIPAQPSMNDVGEAIRSVRNVRQVSGSVGVEIPYAVFLTRCRSVGQERVHRHVRAELEGGGVHLLEIELMDRAAYRSLFSFGGTHYSLTDGQVSGLPAARENSRAFFASVVGELQRQREVVA